MLIEFESKENEYHIEDITENEFNHGLNIASRTYSTAMPKYIGYFKYYGCYNKDDKLVGFLRAGYSDKEDEGNEPSTIFIGITCNLNINDNKLVWKHLFKSVGLLPDD